VHKENKDVQNTGAYQISYHPTNEPDTKDLKHLVMRLNIATNGYWDEPYHEEFPDWMDNGDNSYRRIQHGYLSDWFKGATEATGVSGVPDRKWLVDYTSTNKTILKNYGNAWVWCTDNFADLNKRPVTQHRVFFRSYRDSQPADDDYMADEVGYYSFEVPNTNGND